VGTVAVVVGAGAGAVDDAGVAAAGGGVGAFAGVSAGAGWGALTGKLSAMANRGEPAQASSGPRTIQVVRRKVLYGKKQTIFMNRPLNTADKL